MLSLEHEHMPDNAEEAEWTPSVTLRPHHFLWEREVRNTIKGKKDSRMWGSLSVLLFSIAQHFDSSGYYADEVGKGFGDLHNYRRSARKFYDILRKLPDEAVVHLDLKPDGICNSCAVGKHCMAINLGLWGPIRGGDKEEEPLSRIHRELVQKGCKKGKDFIFKLTTHTMFNFDGLTLRQGNNPQPQTVTFNSMLVKMGALREII